MAKKIFVGSSQQSLPIAEELGGLLRSLGAEVTLWTCEKIFIPARSFLDTVVKAPELFNGAVFVFGRDDKRSRKGKDGKRYIPRDNVLFEAGLFMDRLGKHAVAVCREEEVHVLSDLDGVKTVAFRSGSDEMRRAFASWLEAMVDDLPLGARENLYMDSRSAIHRVYPIADRFHMAEDVYRHISHIRLMNLAGNLFLNPEISDGGRPPEDEPDPSELLKQIMRDSSATVEIILAEPNASNVTEAALKIHNRNAGGLPEGSIYSAWAALYRMLYCEDGVYSQKHRSPSRRFHIYALKVGMPYAIFNVEFEEPFSRFNHIKIDLYSLCFGAEDDRRSFVIWQQRDPANYQYFKNEFESVRAQEKKYIRAPMEKTMKKWADEWDAMQK